LDSPSFIVKIFVFKIKFMSTTSQGRMLLSHNFNIQSENVPALSRSEFTKIFQAGLGEGYQCQEVDSPHWIVEVLFAGDRSPQVVGEAVATTLAAAREANVEILALGGLKSTPPTSTAPGALQPGEWGVDVVETADGEEFLKSIDWANTVSSRSPETFFAVRRAVKAG
jgi:Protein of unknown function (DUF2656)